MVPETRLHPRTTFPTALICATIFLTCLGLLAIYASSCVSAAQKFTDPYIFVKKQAITAMIGFGAVFVLQFIPVRWIEKATLPTLVASLALLVVVLLPGMASRVKGAVRWISIAGFGFQPAELAKLALILFLARNLSRPSINMENVVWGIGPNLAVFGMFALLLMLQPDFGTTFLLFVMTFIMLFIAGINRRFVFGCIVTGFLAVVAAIIQAPYRLARVTTFLDPWASIKQGGFQLIQSYLAFQNGGFLGRGLGESKQKLFFLPEAHSDFILSVIGEELGLLGILLVIGLYAYIAFLGIQITRMQQARFRKYLSFGLTVILATQACINMGVTMGILPTKGMTLPFVSSGNSSLLVSLVMVGILARLGRDPTEARHETAS